jgi:hypothetical protein
MTSTIYVCTKIGAAGSCSNGHLPIRQKKQSFHISLKSRLENTHASLQFHVCVLLPNQKILYLGENIGPIERFYAKV